MDIVLGVSLTPKTVRMVLVEGEKGDGEIVDHDTFDLSSNDDAATTNAADQVVAAVLGTQESAVEGGHELKSIGITWSDRAEAAEVRDALTARGLTDVILVSDLHAAGALAQAVGRAVGYASTALLFIDRDSATLSVVRSDDGSIVKVLATSLHSTDAMAVLGEMAAAVEAQESPPDGMFVVGSGVDIASVKEHLQNLVGLPVRAPEESSLALARGAALAAANAPAFDAATAGLAYSLDPDGVTAGNEDIGLANAATVMRPVGGVAAVGGDYPDLHDGYPELHDHPAAYDKAEEERKPFLLVGSALASLFVVGVVALVISLAVNIRPTVDQRPEAAPPLVPAAPEAAPQLPEADIPEANVPAPAPPPPAAPAPETIKAPVPVVQEAPQAPAPRQVYVEPPAAAPAPAPAAPAPAPAPAPAAPPVFVPLAPAPVYDPPVILPSLFPPIWRPPVYTPPKSPWNPWPQQPPRHEDDYPQWPPRGDDDDWPQSPPSVPQAPTSVPQAPTSVPQVPQWPGQSGGQGGGSQSPQWPGQTQWPGQSSIGDSRGGSGGGYPGGGGGGYPNGGGGGGGNGGGPNCFLIFCG